jgi:hypothetical protein
VFGRCYCLCVLCGAAFERLGDLASTCGCCEEPEEPRCGVCSSTRGALATVECFEDGGIRGTETVALCKRHAPAFIHEVRVWSKRVLLQRLKERFAVDSFKRHTAPVRRG